MLNLSLIKSTMAERGLSGAKLANGCEVSKEAVSNWLSGESIPRPSNLPSLAAILGVSVQDLFVPDPTEPPAPVIAYRMRQNRAPTKAALEAGDDVGRHLRQLLPFMGTLFAPRHLVSPVVEERYIENIANDIRKQRGLGPTEAISHGVLLELLKEFGSVLIPVYWGGEKVGHENAMSVYLSDSQAYFVLFNLGCRLDDFSYWLAHELGHCLTLHCLAGEEGERFAELFAQTLLFPKQLATKAYEDISKSEAPMERVNWYAGTYGVSELMIIRRIDKVALEAGKNKTGLENTKFFSRWNAKGRSARTASDEIFGTSKPDLNALVSKGAQIFQTPIFRALANWQRAEGGRSPSFVASCLNIKLGDAVELSQLLQQYQD